MSQLLNAISVLATFIASVGIIYFALDCTIGKLRIIKGLMITHTVPVKTIVFLGIGVFIILRFFTFYLPY